MFIVRSALINYIHWTRAKAGALINYIHWTRAKAGALINYIHWTRAKAGARARARAGRQMDGRGILHPLN